MSAKECHPMLEGMSMEMRETFLRDMTRGYVQTAREAHRRVVECKRLGIDDRAETAFRGDVAHCMMMARLARRGILDPPESSHSKYSYDDSIGDRMALASMMADAEEGRDVEVDDRKRAMAASAMHVLTDMERQVAEVYYVGGVSRADAYEMLGMELMTFDTHVRNINVKWKRWLDDLASGRGVQPVLVADVDVPPPVVAKGRRPCVVRQVATAAEQATLEV